METAFRRSTVIQVIKLTLIGLIILTAVLFGITYRWTYTPIGRLDYVPAVLAKLDSWTRRPPVFTEEARRRGNELMRRMSDPFADGIKLAGERDLLLPSADGDVPVRIYIPEGDGPFPIYLYFHGGGFWRGNDHANDGPIKLLAAQASMIVVSVDYRLAPEHPFPAGFNDCYAALQWVGAHGQEFGGDPSRIAVGGSSAGAHLAAAVAMRARDMGGPDIAFQHLFVPSTDLSGTTDWPSYREVGGDYVLTVPVIEKTTEIYIPDPAARLRPYASPLLAKDHSDLPPALIVTAQFDPLRDAGEAYGEKLRQAGVPITTARFDGVLHAFSGSPGKMREHLTMAAEMLKDYLHGQQQ